MPETSIQWREQRIFNAIVRAQLLCLMKYGPIFRVLSFGKKKKKSNFNLKNWLFTYIIYFILTKALRGDIFISILQIWKPSLREVKKLSLRSLSQEEAGLASAQDRFQSLSLYLRHHHCHNFSMFGVFASASLSL